MPIMSADMQLGYYSGLRLRRRDPNLSDGDIQFCARLMYLNVSQGLTVDEYEYTIGWYHGYSGGGGVTIQVSLDRNMLYADGAFKLAHVEGPNGLTCLDTVQKDPFLIN